MRGSLITLLIISVVVGMELPRNRNMEYPKVFRSVPVKSSPIYNGGARKRVLNHLDTPTFQDSNNSPSSEYGVPSQSYNSPSNSYGAPASSQSYDAPATKYVFGQPSPSSDTYNAPPPSNTYESPSPSVSYSSSDISNEYNSPPSNSYNSPPAPPSLSVSYGSPPSTSYESPHQSDMYDVPNPSPADESSPSTSDDSSPTSSYDSPSPPPTTTYGVEEPHKRVHKFKIIPVLVLFGFFMILLTWVFLRVGFFTQVGVAGNFRRSFDSFLSVLESWDDYPGLEALTGNVLEAITSSNGFQMADKLKKSR